MRYDAEHKQRTHERLLKAAARAIRRDGPERVSVAAVMGEVGLTHGGFYAHFRSRDDLIAEGIDQMFRESGARLAKSLEGRGPREALLDYVEFYLSSAHRNARTSGCPLPFLSGDAPRFPKAARARFAAGVQAMEDRLASVLAQLGWPEPQADAGALVAELVGTMALARAEPDDARAERMLQSARNRIVRRLQLDGG